MTKRTGQINLAQERQSQLNFLEKRKYTFVETLQDAVGSHYRIRFSEARKRKAEDNSRQKKLGGVTYYEFHYNCLLLIHTLR